MKRIMIAAISVVLLTGMAMAQDAPPPPGGGPGGPGGPRMERPRGMMREGMGMWWKNSELAQKLNLSDQQKQQLEKTFNDYKLKLIDLRADVERQETKLKPMMDAAQLDAKGIPAQIDAIVAARGRLERTMMMMHFDLVKVLTPEQWKQLQAMRDQHREERREYREERGRERRRMNPNDTMRPEAQPTAPPAMPPPPGEF